MKSSYLALAFAWMLSSFAGVNSASAQSRLQPIKGSSVSVSPSKANVPVRREVKKLVVSIASPNGFEYAGVDENEQSMGDYGFAPAKAFLTAKVKSNSETAQYAWKYKTVTMGSNMEDKTSASQSISFKTLTFGPIIRLAQRRTQASICNGATRLTTMAALTTSSIGT